MDTLERTEISRDEERFHPPVKYFKHVFEASIKVSEALKNFFDQNLISETNYQKALWQGGVFLNSKRLDEKCFPQSFEPKSVFEVYYFVRDPEPILLTPQHILWEGEGALAVNKPAWLPVQGTRASLRFGLQEELRKLTGHANLNAIHRLDRETSGIVLFAFEKKSEAWLMKQFHDQQVTKKYKAVITPPATLDAWETKGYLVRDFRRLPQNYYRLREKECYRSKYSETTFRQIKIENQLALVEASPKTGRTHQIRVHLASQKTPILGDTIYAKRDKSLPRLQLHACEIKFPFFKNRQRMMQEIEAPLPDDFVLR